jgi:hypothetical protein
MGKKEFGDFQTPEPLAREIVALVKAVFGAPSIIVEPTCGTGNFLKAAYDIFGDNCNYHGFEINPQYVEISKTRFQNKKNIVINVQDFFSWDLFEYFKKYRDEPIIVLGNPPWVTNSALGVIGSKNLPKKSNFQGLNGFAAKTGKANFDIAEWILIRLIEQLKDKNACLVMLCKFATARKVLKHFWSSDDAIGKCSIYTFDAQQYFDVSVSACALIVECGQDTKTKNADIYDGLSRSKLISHCGLAFGELVSNVDNYVKYNAVDGFDYYPWRSGVKHDATKIMELTEKKGLLFNGFGELVDIEDTFLYPLLKSSDLGNSRLVPRKNIIVTQSSVGENTEKIKEIAPKTWNYLISNAQYLDKRKSIIYKKRPRFSIFGVGDYSFAPWKVAVSGLYKNIKFRVIGGFKSRPIIVDDTCYFIPCHSEYEANYLCRLLNSDHCQNFIESLVFFDSKRPINVDILKRIDLKKLAEIDNSVDVGMKYFPYARSGNSGQLTMVFEHKKLARKKTGVASNGGLL